MKILLTFCLTALFAFVSQSQSRELTWSDEFNYEGLPDDTKWGYDVGGSGWDNQELQYYTEDRLKNARVENGNLIIEAHHEFFSGKIYTSARLITKNKGDWKYGYFEMRAKLPSGRGTWPAFWMLPTDWEYGGWPDSGEIDIMEHVGYDAKNVVGTVHTKAYNHSIGTQVGVTKALPDCETEFHVYACEWTENKIIMYIDDELYFSFNNQGSWQKWPFDKRFHILLNIAVGGSWGGLEGIDETAFPTQFLIDYIRVYAPGTKPSGLIDKGASDKILVYPNPTQSAVFVDLREIKSNSPIDITIFNSMGQVVTNKLVEKNQQLAKLDLSDKAESAYFYVIRNESGILKRGGIVKN